MAAWFGWFVIVSVTAAAATTTSVDNSTARNVDVFRQRLRAYLGCRPCDAGLCAALPPKCGETVLEIGARRVRGPGAPTPSSIVSICSGFVARRTSAAAAAAGFVAPQGDTASVLSNQCCSQDQLTCNETKAKTETSK